MVEEPVPKADDLPGGRQTRERWLQNPLGLRLGGPEHATALQTVERRSDPRRPGYSPILNDLGHFNQKMVDFMRETPNL